MTTFDLSILERDGSSTPLPVTPARVYNLGSATVDPTSAVAHQEEVADVGVRIAFDIPAPRIYPMAVSSITTDDVIGVHHGETSGEVELVIVVVEGEVYLGIGSDHTDRVLERESIIWSKQYSPSVLGGQVWRWNDVEPHWDRLVLESWVDGKLYQSSPAAVFRRPDDLLAVLAERVVELPKSYLVYCGTYTTIANTIEFGTTWTARLADSETATELALRYDVVDLLGEIADGFRVPLRPAEA
jgi:hypothetical protein